MIRNLFPALGIIVLLASCSSMRPGFSNQAQASGTSTTSQVNAKHTKSDPRFLDDISVETGSSEVKTQAVTKNRPKAAGPASQSDISLYMNRAGAVEKASAIQLKYAVLLNTEVEQLTDNKLLPHVDEWYGTRYRMGGTSKSGVDCSAFVQAVYLSAFGLAVPRTAREQYRSCQIISATDLEEGDLLFFNTTGGVSHVGIYLRNNKFIHASSSQGVTVSDMFDPYYLKRYIGAGRVSKN